MEEFNAIDRTDPKAESQSLPMTIANWADKIYQQETIRAAAAQKLAGVRERITLYFANKEAISVTERQHLGLKVLDNTILKDRDLKDSVMEANPHYAKYAAKVGQCDRRIKFLEAVIRHLQNRYKSIEIEARLGDIGL